MGCGVGDPPNANKVKKKKKIIIIIYAGNKADVEISAPDENYCAYQKSRRPSYAPIRKSGAQTLHLLTIWARQNLQLPPSLAEELSFR